MQVIQPFEQSQQRKFAESKIKLKKYSQQDIVHKRTKINSWFDQNRGLEAEDFKINYKTKHKDMIAFADCFLFVYDILKNLVNENDCGDIIENYSEVVDNLNFSISKLRNLVQDAECGFGLIDVRFHIQELVLKDYNSMNHIINFIINNTKITAKKDPFENMEFEE